jgi:DNA-directed RNA polymerase subunit N (RpoN/RPB10)|uniref:DNA-directed RNA polymerase n=1 Tax=viral metagenome TaxID=1070528 RepID=A0A6C0BF38_9ZZZZ
MIIPVRCFTCGKVLADKWEYYENRCKEIEKENIEVPKHFDKHPKGKVLDELQLTKMCCRRHMLGHVDLIETI